jgi:E3 ubiquitin-protein ligase TRIP12
VFCGLRYHPWDVAELAASCRAEHGFTGESEVVRWLFEMLAEFGPEDQRSFVSFITGCPNLPIGGAPPLDCDAPLSLPSLCVRNCVAHFLHSLPLCTAVTGLTRTGFRGLRPPLTIVPKSRGAEAAMDLPSVMTCQNYLKLPEYGSRAVLAERLLLAMREGQGSFLLS